MLKLRKSAKGKSREDDAKRIHFYGLRIFDAIAAQVSFARKNFRTDIDYAWQGGYCRYYLFGAYDATTLELPLETRLKVGPPIIEVGFMHAATQLFDLTEVSAKKALAAIFTLQATNPAFPPIVDGGLDGNEARQGKPALRLLAHLYGERTDPGL